MPSNKDRLYVSLYFRGGTAKMPGGEDKYHWALIVGPKLEAENSRGTRYHAKDGPPIPGQDKWAYDERETSMMATGQQLVRVLIGKVEDAARVVSVLRSVPIVQDDPTWNCVKWVRDALEALKTDKKALGTSRLDWELVKNTALKYCEDKKKEHRFDGKGNIKTLKAATYDLLEGKETVP